jgi:hypothetical protein
VALIGGGGSGERDSAGSLLSSRWEEPTRGSAAAATGAAFGCVTSSVLMFVLGTLEWRNLPPAPAPAPWSLPLPWSPSAVCGAFAADTLSLAPSRRCRASHRSSSCFENGTVPGRTYRECVGACTAGPGVSFLLPDLVDTQKQLTVCGLHCSRQQTTVPTNFQRKTNQAQRGCDGHLPTCDVQNPACSRARLATPFDS